jgi:hypothetical protein
VLADLQPERRCEPSSRNLTRAGRLSFESSKIRRGSPSPQHQVRTMQVSSARARTANACAVRSSRQGLQGRFASATMLQRQALAISTRLSD